MIDTLKRLLPMAQRRDILARYRLQDDRYGVVTLHRPANVDCRETVAGLLDVLLRTSRHLRLVFPVHPRTRKRLEEFGRAEQMDASREMIQLPPLAYLDFLALTSRAKVIITDSGGLQEESTVLGIPCLTVRPNTERPITVDEGTSTLVGNDPSRLQASLEAALNKTYKRGRCPALWDGRAAERIAVVLADSRG